MDMSHILMKALKCKPSTQHKGLTTSQRLFCMSNFYNQTKLHNQLANFCTNAATCSTNKCEGSLLVNIITWSIQLPTSCACVCTTPLLNEVELDFVGQLTHNIAYALGIHSPCYHIYKFIVMHPSICPSVREVSGNLKTQDEVRVSLATDS